MTWKAFGMIVCPLSASLLAATWGLNRATVADARATTADLQQSIDRVLQTQQILLQRAVAGSGVNPQARSD